jgi:hypothetical protein
MEKQLEEKLLDRLADLAKGNEERTLEYLAKAERMSAAERYGKWMASQKADGMRAVKAWLHDDDIAALKQRFPGPRGGIDWPAVAKAALSVPVKTTQNEVV